MAIVREQPYSNDRFRVSIDGLPEESFAEVALPVLGETVVDYREGGEHNTTVRKLPGRSKFGNLTLKRGFTGTLTLWEWYRQVMSGEGSTKRNVTVSLLDEASHTVATWRMIGAWPVRYAFTPLVAQGRAVLEEEVELSCDAVEMS